MDASRFSQSRDWQTLYLAYRGQGHPDDRARLLADSTLSRLLMERVLPALNNAAQAGAYQAAQSQEQQERYRRELEQRRRREEERQREQLQHQEAAQANDEGGEEDGDAHVEIYEQYRPAKVTEGPPHPDPIVETASLASVTPPDITYKHHLQDNLVRGELSNAQLETVLYAFQRFERRLPDGHRAGFFLGDGAGVGKGRQIAAVIKEYWAAGGRRVLWVSTSNDLRYDARRDLGDLGMDEATIPVYPPRKDAVPAGNLDKVYPKGGVLFITYSLLVSKGSYKPPAASGGAKRGRNSGGSGAAAGGGGGGGRARGRARYGAYGGAGFGGSEELNDEAAGRVLEHKRAEVRRLFGAGTRLHQIVNWLGGPQGDGECLIVLDECHKAKNLLDAAGNSSQTGLAVESLQDQLLNARVLYSSATGASEPDNLRYMVRLGAFDYPHIGDMINALKRSGLGALEMFCMGLKATGTYVSRTLSYKGAEFKNEELQIDPIYSVMYDRSCALWSLVHNVMRALPKTKNARGRDMKASLFWGAHQRFYRQMLIASKVKRCAELAQDALDRGMCVVIGLQSTGEANLNSAREAAAGGGGGAGGGGAEEEGMEDFVSAPKMILHNFISQWLFHFSEPVSSLMSKRKMQHLQSEVYRACVEWRKQPSAAEEADKAIRLAKIEAAQAARAGARAATAAAGSAAVASGRAGGRAGQPSAAADGAGTSTAGALAYGSAVAKKSAPRYDEVDDSDSDSIGVEIPDSDEEGAGAADVAAAAKGSADAAGGSDTMAAAAAAAVAASGSDSEGDPQVLMERSLDEALAEKRRRALLAGDLIDLADGDEPGDAAVDAERQRLLAEADAEEAAEAEAAERRKREERLAKLEAALAEAREEAEKARSAVQRLEQAEKGAADGAAAAANGIAAAGAYGIAAPVPAAGRRRCGGTSNSGGGSTAVAAADKAGLEDDMDCDKENTGAPSAAAAADAAAAGSKPSRGERRGAAAVLLSESEEEEDDDDRPLAAAAGAKKGATGGGRRRSAAALEDEDNEDADAGPAAGGMGKGPAAAAAQSRPMNSSGRRAPSGSSAAEEQQQTSQGGSKKRARVGVTPDGGNGGSGGGQREEVVTSPVRSARGAARKAAAKIAATAGGTRALPPKPPKGPSAPKAAAAAMSAAVKLEPGTSRRGGAGTSGAAAAKSGKSAPPTAAAKSDESDDVIVISDSEENGKPAKKQAGGSAKKAAGKRAGGRMVNDKAAKDKDEPEEVEEEEGEEGEEDETEEDEEEDEEDETVCAKCGGGDRPHTILLCDGCDDEYHMACLEPPLKSVPKGEWHCPKCTIARAAKTSGGSAKAPSGSAGQKRKASYGCGSGGAAGAAASKAAKPTKSFKGKTRAGSGNESDQEEDQDMEAAEADEEQEEEDEGVGGVKRQKTASGGGKTASGGGKAAAAAAKKAGKAAAAPGKGKGRRRASVEDDVKEEGSGATSSSSSSGDEDSDLSEESAEGVDDSDDDDFVAEARGGSKRGGRLQRGAAAAQRVGGGVGRGAQGTRGSAAARFAGDSETGDDDDADDLGGGCGGGGGGSRGGSVNVFKVRMQLRAARQRLKEAEQRLASAQRDLSDHERATSNNRRANGGNVGGVAAAAGGGRNQRGSSGDSREGSSSSGSSDGDEDEDSGGAVPAARRAGGGAPAVYRHAVKSKPLAKIPASWKAGKGGGGAGGRGRGRGRGGGGGGTQRGGPQRGGDGDEDESDDDDSDDDDSDSDHRSSSEVTLEEEEEGGSSGEEVELVEEGVGGSGRRGRGQEAGGAALPHELRKCRAMLLRLLEAQELPMNPLDQLTELLGGEGKVAEMTGRKVLQVRNEQGRIVCKQRRDDEAQKMVNIAEKNDFMNGTKLVAIISDAASTGISLQADRRVANQRRRFHITLELPWSADKAIQQFGRSHRSNQASAPEYCLLVTKCGGEYRFAGAVAKRLTSLGALLRGDRRALGASSDLKPYDVDNRYGEAAVGRLLDCVSSGVHNVAGAKVGELPPGLLPPAAAASPPGSGERATAFLQHMQRCLKTMGLLADVGGGTFVIEKKDSATSVTKFLNRLLGLPLRDQDLMFSYFFGIMESLIKQARSAGSYEEGILNLANSSVAVAAEQTVHVDGPTGAVTSYMELDVDDGMSWEEACRALEAALEDMRSENAPQAVMNRVGFYVSRRSANVGGTGHPLVVLATALRRTTLSARPASQFRIQRPNQVKGYTFTQYELEEKYRKVDVKEGERQWQFWYHYLHRGCLHGDHCVRRKREGKCNFGSRFYRLHLVTGALLPVLRKLFDTVLRSGATKKAAPRVARVVLRNTEDNNAETANNDTTTGEERQQAVGASGSRASGGGGGVFGSSSSEGRVVVGLSLTERDAEAFLQTVAM